MASYVDDKDPSITPEVEHAEEEKNPSAEEPGGDIGVAEDSSLTVKKAILACKHEAEVARKPRLKKNELNNDAYMGRQDWSQKRKGQSKEFIPKVPMAAEQIAAFVKKALIDFGDWFSVEKTKASINMPLQPNEIRRWLKAYLEDKIGFAALISDSVKAGLLNSLMIVKIIAVPCIRRKFTLVPADEPTLLKKVKLVERKYTYWDVKVEMVNPRDMYIDPTGRNLYKIHHSQKDLSEVIRMAEKGEYDLEAVEQIKGDFKEKKDEWIREKEKGQQPSAPPEFRKMVEIDEFWGTLLDEEGKIVHEQVVCTLANEKYIIRKPEPFPYWHGEDPFVISPLVRVPWSVWHKALFDHVVSLNLALNELYNLMLDGGLASVWGVRQLRVRDLQDPGQVSDGIPQGLTLKVKDSLPPGAKVMETVATGEIPPAAPGMYTTTDKEVQASSLVNDMKLGLLPPRQVKATEVIEATQQSAVFFDSMIKDIEVQFIDKIIDKVWAMMLEYSDDMDKDELLAIIGKDAFTRIGSISAEERFVAMYQGSKFKVNGLSSILARIKDFQKLTAFLQVCMGNAVLLQSFTKKFSPDKILDTIVKTLNINPDNISLDEDEKKALPDRMKELPMFQNIAGGGGQSQNTPGGPASVTSDINQSANPTGNFRGGSPQ